MEQEKCLLAGEQGELHPKAVDVLERTWAAWMAGPVRLHGEDTDGTSHRLWQHGHLPAWTPHCLQMRRRV